MMKKRLKISGLVLLFINLTISLMAIGQANPSVNFGSFEPNDAYPFGRLNPAAPEETKQFDFMIGACDCIDSLKNPADGQWYVFNTIWNAKYVMDGFAIQDMGWNPIFSPMSIRVYNSQSKLWEVTFFRMPKYQTGVWTGKKEGDNMVMRQQKTGTNGVKGESRLTFYDIDQTGFKWKAEFIGEDDSYSSGWRIVCKKR